MPLTVEQLVVELAECLRTRGERLATAESCTGGWVAKLCTDLAGSSAWFECGFVTYSNQAKQRMLNVPAATLEDFGAVSEQTVQAMAAGALANSRAHRAVAISGIAGPEGGSLNKPVGTVWLAWVGADGWRASRHCRFDGGREAVRRQAVYLALQVMLAHCRSGE